MFAIINALIAFITKGTPGENQIIKKYTFALVLGLQVQQKLEKSSHKFHKHDALRSVKRASLKQPLLKKV